MEKKLITEEGKRSLLSILKDNIKEQITLLDYLRPYIRKMNDMVEYKRTLGLESSDLENGLIRMYEYNMLLSMISLDLSSAYRVYLKAEESYEVIYATKHLVVIINEAYKKIYNYVWPNEKGNIRSSERNKSFWVKDIGGIISRQITELKPEYDRLTVMLDTYHDPELRSMKIPRDMFVHYDDTPSDLYDVLCKLDIEEVTQKVIPFLEIIRQMIEFTNQLQQLFTNLISVTTENAFDEHQQILEDMKTEKLNNPEALKIIETGQSNLAEMKLQYYETFYQRKG